MRKYLTLVLGVALLALLFAAGCTRKVHPDDVLVPVPEVSSPTVVSVEGGAAAQPSPTPTEKGIAGAPGPKAAVAATPTPSPASTNTPVTPTNTPAQPPTPTPVPPTATPVPSPTPTLTPTPAPSPTPAPAPTATSAPVPTQPSAGAKYTVYSVKPGDTLFSIAVKYGTTVAEIMRINGLKSYMIYSGQQLKVPVGYVSYIVKPGDTLYSIALTHHVSTSAIIAANHISNPDLLFVGQRLIIPTKGSSMPVMGKPVYHIVRPGETLAYIAQKYGVSIRALQVANHIRNPNLIYVGQRLRIP
jgi:LysM repeat protein